MFQSDFSFLIVNFWAFIISTCLLVQVYLANVQLYTKMQRVLGKRKRELGESSTPDLPILYFIPEIDLKMHEGKRNYRQSLDMMNFIPMSISKA